MYARSASTVTSKFQDGTDFIPPAPSPPSPTSAGPTPCPAAPTPSLPCPGIPRSVQPPGPRRAGRIVEVWRGGICQWKASPRPAHSPATAAGRSPPRARETTATRSGTSDDLTDVNTSLRTAAVTRAAVEADHLLQYRQPLTSWTRSSLDQRALTERPNPATGPVDGHRSVAATLPSFPASTRPGPVLIEPGFGPWPGIQRAVRALPVRRGQR